jgi:tRNA(Arg) A34 adenosine deaminase TadA
MINKSIPCPAIPYESLPSSLKRAREARLMSDHPQHQLGAVIIQKNKIISFGANYIQKTHPAIRFIGKNEHKTLHAEMVCILKIKNKDILKGATIAVYREKKDGSFGLSKPCSICYRFLKYYGIKKVIYTTEDGVVEELV